MNSVISVCLLATLPLYCLLLTVGKGEGQFVPGRCECYDTKTTVRGPLSDLKVTFKGVTCKTDQIIVVEKRTSEPVCVNPKGPQGKQLLHCWKITRANGLDKKRCLRQRRQGEPRTETENSGDNLKRAKEEGQQQSLP